MSKIEIALEWDPDGGGSIEVFVDGVKADDYEVNWVDPGRGAQLTDWREETDRIRGEKDYSPAYRDYLVDLREQAENSQYVEDDRYPPLDLAHRLRREDGLVDLWEHYVDLHEEDKDRLDTFACEQVSREFLSLLREGGWDKSWLMHGEDPDSVDGMVGDHWWVVVDDDGMLEHFDLTAQQFANVEDPRVRALFEERGEEWPLQWHTSAEEPQHFLIPYRTVTQIDPTHP